MKLSVLMPVYNESKTLETIINKIQAVPLEKEIIIVDDCSSDDSREILKNYINLPGFKIIFHEKNIGKGGSIITAINQIEGDIVIIQDADLEYDPDDYLKLIKPIENKETKVVYGSRLLKKNNKKGYNMFLLGGVLVTFVTNLLFGLKLTDEPTCYKVFDAELLKSIDLKCKRFEFCPEVTAKIAKRGIKIPEIPINYYPRSILEGKKIKWTDGLSAIWTLIKFRIIN